MGDKGNWTTATIVCDICTHEWIGVYLLESDKLECPNCENMVHFEVKETT